MFVDILMAFVFSLILEIVFFKRIATFLCCIIAMFVYFINGCKIDFIGEMDFAIWILFVIMFNMILHFATNKIEKKIKK